MTRNLPVLAFLMIAAAGIFPAPQTVKSAELLLFESETCEWCEKWREEIGEVYPKTEEGKFAPLRTIDIHQTRPPEYRNVKRVVFTPTFVLWHDNREFGRILGYTDEAFFWGLLGELIDDVRAGRPVPRKPADPATPVSGTPVPSGLDSSR